MPELLLNLLQVIISLAALIYAADRFVAGAVTIAQFCKITPMVIGMTIVAIGTSAPEIVVAIVAALRGSPEIGIGNAIGSNIANIGLVLGGTALVHDLVVKKRDIQFEIILLIVTTLFASIMLWDLLLSNLEGAILLGFYIFAFCWLIYRNRKKHKIHGNCNTNISYKNLYIGIAWFCFGLILLLLSSDYLVAGATGIAKWFGVSELIIGLTIVAIGTSLPELATSVMGAAKGEYELAIGNVIGSNIANLTLVLGPIGLIKPTTLSHELRINIIIMLIATIVMLLAISFGNHKINKKIGGVFFIAYAIYLTFVTLMI